MLIFHSYVELPDDNHPIKTNKQPQFSHGFPDVLLKFPDFSDGFPSFPMVSYGFHPPNPPGDPPPRPRLVTWP